MQTTDNHEGHHPSSDLNRPSHPQDLRTSTLTILTVTQVATTHADEEAPELDLLTIPPRWALSPLDWQAHAIDPWADHPLGVWIARCGHRLLSGTTLHDTPPGSRCPACTRWSQPQRTQDTTGTTQ